MVICCQINGGPPPPPPTSNISRQQLKFGHAQKVVAVNRERE